MTREYFEHLCHHIESNVDKGFFKSQDFLTNLKYPDNTSEKTRIPMMRAHKGSISGFVSGEKKVTITLCLLAGGLYLDLAMLSKDGSSYAYEIFYEDIIKNWILDDRLVKIKGVDYMNDEDCLERIALEFAWSLGGLFNGCISDIDGWIVTMRKPTTKDNVSNPSSFFSRKGYIGCNVVAIVDRKKIVLHSVIGSRGANHNSNVFKNSSLYQWLMENWE